MAVLLEEIWLPLSDQSKTIRIGINTFLNLKIMSENFNRRDFLRAAAAGGIGLALSPSEMFSKTMGARPLKKSKNEISVGIIGVGNRGRWLMKLAANMPNTKITAICDINPKAITLAQQVLAEDGHKPAEVYTGSETAYRDLLERKDIDAVIIAATWDWHVPMAVDAMEAKKYVGLEVPAAMTIEDCWKLVETYEKTGTNIMFLENCCYDRECMAVLNMLRDGLLGTPMHATCGYRHSAYGSQKWLGPINTETKAEHFFKYCVLRNADQYPTHGIGPVAYWFDINCGNRMLYLTSVATKSAVINEYVREKGGPNHPNANFPFKQGDLISTTIKTVKGETIVMTYDNYLPRPYSRDYSLQGTKGIWDGLYRSRGIYIEGVSPKKDQWEKGEDYDKYMQKYDSRIWVEESANAKKGGGHGGIDYLTVKEFLRCAKEDAYPPIDIYDAAAWSCIIELSEKSIANGSTPEYFPDFTRGKWETRKPTFGF